MRIDALGHQVEIDETVVSEPETEIRRQVKEYLDGNRKSFDLQVKFPSSFTGKVMKQMMEIGYGKTESYGEIASRINSSPIAVGQACGRNPVPLIVPCHRVVGKNGLGGYQYPGLKQKLLEIEQG